MLDLGAALGCCAWLQAGLTCCCPCRSAVPIEGEVEYTLDTTTAVPVHVWALDTGAARAIFAVSFRYAGGTRLPAPDSPREPSLTLFVAYMLNVLYLYI